MEVRRVLLLSVILSNLPTLKCSVLFNSARTPPGDTQFAHLGILNFQDCRILVPRLRPTSYLNMSETTESIRICILLSCGSLPANEIFGVALFPSSVKHLRIVFPMLVNWRSKRSVCIMLTHLHHSVPAVFLMLPFVCWTPFPSRIKIAASFVDYVQDCKADIFPFGETWFTPAG